MLSPKFNINTQTLLMIVINVFLINKIDTAYSIILEIL